MQLQELYQLLAALDNKRKEHAVVFDALTKQLWQEGFSLYWDDENERYCVYPIPISLTGSDKKHDE